jgi:hypothetical protein
VFELADGGTILLDDASVTPIADLERAEVVRDGRKPAVTRWKRRVHWRSAARRSIDPLEKFGVEPKVPEAARAPG